MGDEEKNKPFTKEFFDTVIGRLRERKVKKICPMCENNNLSIVEYYGFDKFFVKESTFNETGRGIPAIMIICNNCGYIMHHALGPLQLLDEKKEENKK